MMAFTKKKNIPGLAIFLDITKLPCYTHQCSTTVSLETFILYTFKNALKFLTLVLNYDNGSQFCIITYQAVF